MKRAREDDQIPAPPAKKKTKGIGDPAAFNARLKTLKITGFLAEVLRMKYDYFVLDLPAKPRDTVVAALTQATFNRLEKEYDQRDTGRRISARLQNTGVTPLGPIARAVAAWEAADEAVRLKAEQDYAKAINEQKISQDQMARNNLNLMFLHVGQGDCTFIQTPGLRTVMIDCGTCAGIEEAGTPNVRTGLGHVMSAIRGLVYSDRRANKTDLDILIFTHPDRDHHNKLGKVSAEFAKIKRVYHSNRLRRYIDGDTNTSQHVQSVCAAAGRKRTRVRRGEKTINGVAAKKADQRGTDTEWVDEHGALVILQEEYCTIRILAAEVGFPADELINPNDAVAANRASLVTLIEAFGKRILICGDATKATEQYLLDTYRNTHLAQPIDILRCSHHGSDEDCNISGFVAALRAKEVIVSAAMKSNPGHGLPAVEVMKRFWSRASAGDAAHNSWFWYKHSLTDTTRTSDDLYGTKLTDLKPNIATYKLQKVWTTGSSGTIRRTFART